MRATLEPLAPGERPGAVTVAVIVCAIGALVLTVGVAAGLIDTAGGKVSGVVSSIVILVVAGAGMWRARYWAVLGFQAVLTLNIIVMFLLLLRASSTAAAAIAVAVIVPAGLLFWKLVRAMARIQMPERRPRPR